MSLNFLPFVGSAAHGASHDVKARRKRGHLLHGVMVPDAESSKRNSFRVDGQTFLRMRGIHRSYAASTQNSGTSPSAAPVPKEDFFAPSTVFDAISGDPSHVGRLVLFLSSKTCIAVRDLGSAPGLDVSRWSQMSSCNSGTPKNVWIRRYLYLTY